MKKVMLISFLVLSYFSYLIVAVEDEMFEDDMKFEKKVGHLSNSILNKDL